ncbi:bifunctional hydroxymethylpyrimidine kinase/phosphomethylpyrimidine kinase [Methanogenium cariaci]|uniref:bifunctional hydroxymethylpyrimidine kinase/phosphomethylpyrimidine kinase n=1 Tax=Methanogenium cariaci TaxID=2197 RepID=UPI0007846296|nr:bifunctional hydroxymethylpyrimidine kinase/phosphomethylpyrimidine kinase [Methanogenium cariaci]
MQYYSNGTTADTLRCTIAGSDSGGGGAGIQADLKTFSALGGVWGGCTVITAVTSQNTRAVLSSLTVDTHTLTCQMDAVFQDFAISAVKTGMLPDAKTIETVAENLPPRAVSLVVDPVMIATSGKRLASREGVSALCERLIPPRAALVTPPNIPELCVLTKRETITTVEEMTAAGRELLAMGAKAVLIKGGHLTTETSPPDVFLCSTEQMVLDGPPRYPPYEVHGSGCALAAAITAYLVRGEMLPEACRQGEGVCLRRHPGRGARLLREADGQPPRRDGPGGDVRPQEITDNRPIFLIQTKFIDTGRETNQRII